MNSQCILELKSTLNMYINISIYKMLMEHYKDQCYNKHPNTYIARLIPSLQRSTSIKCNKGGKTFFSSAVASLYRKSFWFFIVHPLRGKNSTDFRTVERSYSKKPKSPGKKKRHGDVMGKKHRNVPCRKKLLKNKCLKLLFWYFEFRSKKYSWA